jgi:threonine aldolase
MVWLDLKAAGISTHDFIALGEKAGLRFMGGRLVVHYQIGDEAVQRLANVFGTVLQGKELALNGTVDTEPEKLAESAKVAR